MNITQTTEETKMLKLYYFSADFCQPCKTFAPIVERVCKQTGTELIKVDISTPEGEQLATAEGVRGVPTIVLSKNGCWQDTRQGMMTENGLRALIGSVAG